MTPYIFEIENIYLHWTATPYQWGGFETNGDPAYHRIYDDKGASKTIQPFTKPLNAHTYGRNHNSIALSLCCMDPHNGEWSVPPTEAQLHYITKDCAIEALKLKWDAENLQFKIMTHAEAAANRDFPINIVEKYSFEGVTRNGGRFYPSSNWDRAARSDGLPHANYGPSKWPDKWPTGDCYRWDLAKLRESDKMGIGGHELRQRIAEWMKKL